MKWISVEDRLPDNKEVVLFLDKDNGLHCIGYREDGYDNWFSRQYQHQVSHWMPLPEPPKED